MMSIICIVAVKNLGCIIQRYITFRYLIRLFNCSPSNYCNDVMIVDACATLYLISRNHDFVKKNGAEKE